MNRQILVPVAVLGAVIALIGALVLFGDTAPAPDGARPVAGQAPAAAKPDGARKAPPRVDPSKLIVRQEIQDRPAAPAGAPNVVLVVVNALRRDQLGVYDGPEGTSPTLDKVASEGTHFLDVVSTGLWNRPAMVSLLTGLDGGRVGMIDPGEEANTRLLSDKVITLPERLAARGWHTVGVTANFNQNSDFGMAQGYDAFFNSASTSFVPPNRVHGKEVVQRLFRLLDERPEGAQDRPVFASLVLVDPHKPIQIPPDEFKQFEGPDHSIAPYRAVVKRVDDAVAELLEGLKSRGLNEQNTLFVLVADHGEGLGMPAHHGKQHGRTFYRSVAQVPWILRGPGVPAGKAIPELASLADLTPTLMGLLGDPITSERLDGLDLSGLITGKGEATRRDKAWIDNWYQGANAAAVYTADKVCIKDFGTAQGEVAPTGCFSRKDDPDGNAVLPADDDPLLKELITWREALWAEYRAWPEVRNAEIKPQAVLTGGGSGGAGSGGAGSGGGAAKGGKAKPKGSGAPGSGGAGSGGAGSGGGAAADDEGGGEGEE